MEIVGGLCCLGISGGNIYVWNELRKKEKSEKKVRGQESEEKYTKHAASQTEMFLEEFRRSQSSLCGLDKLCGGSSKSRVYASESEENPEESEESEVLKNSAKSAKSSKVVLRELKSNPDHRISAKIHRALEDSVEELRSVEETSYDNKVSTSSKHRENTHCSINSLDRFDIETDEPVLVQKNGVSESQKSVSKKTLSRTDSHGTERSQSAVSVRSPSLAERMRESSPLPIGLKGTLLNNNYEHSEPTTLIDRTVTPIVSVSVSESSSDNETEVDRTRSSDPRIVEEYDNFESDTELENFPSKSKLSPKHSFDLTPSLIEQRKLLFDNEASEREPPFSNAPSEYPEKSISMDPVSLDMYPSPPGSDFYRKPYEFGPVLDSPVPTPSKLSFSMPRKQQTQYYTPKVSASFNSVRGDDENLQRSSIVKIPRSHRVSSGNRDLAPNIISNINYVNLGAGESEKK